MINSQTIWLRGLICIIFFVGCQKRAPKPQEEPRVPEDLCTIFFDNTNTKAVQNGAVNPTFTLNNDDPSILCELYTYHWNNGAGKAPGTIGLKNLTTGVIYGPYPAIGTPGQNGAPNVNWDVKLNPRVVLKPGIYEVIDSDNPSWSWNATSMDKAIPAKAAGFAKVWLEMGN